MFVPFPYDWIASWKDQYNVKLSPEAEADLIDILERVSTKS